MRRKRNFLIAFLFFIVTGLIVVSGVVSSKIFRSEMKIAANILFSQASFPDQFSIFSKSETFLGHIIRVKSVFLNSINPRTPPETLHLKIPPKQLAQLVINRKKAIEVGLLTERTKVNGTLEWRGNIYLAKLNLKGNLPAHWRNSKQWSLKVRLMDGGSIYGFTNFSISKHYERQFPDNQLAARTLSNFGVPAPQHRTTKVYVNGHNWGPMLVEEEFSNAYLEQRGLKVAPIIGFQSEQWWIKSALARVYNVDIPGSDIINSWADRLYVKVLNRKKILPKSWDPLISMAKNDSRSLIFLSDHWSGT